MVATDISLTLNRKTDLSRVKEELFKAKLQCPVYLLQSEHFIDIQFCSEYEEWELDNALETAFPGYHFISDIENGRKEVRLIFSRFQSPLSTDDWGRQIEAPLNQTKYLVKKSKVTLANFQPEVQVLFGKETVSYHVHVADGVNRRTGELGHLVMDAFNSSEVDNETPIFKDHMYKTAAEAFYYGIEKMKPIVEKDFEAFKIREKADQRDKEKLPRKLIRTFINSCNDADKEAILKVLTEDFIYQKQKLWPDTFKTEGKENFGKWINTQQQDICSQAFKIRSNWLFAENGSIRIGVKSEPKSPGIDGHEPSYMNRYRYFTFWLTDLKITRILEE